MKKAISVLLALLPFVVFAQSQPSSFYSKYANKEGFTTVTISPKAFELLASLDIDDADYQDAKDMISEITGIQVLAVEDEEGKNLDRAKQLYQEAISSVGVGYDELVSVKEDGTDVKILVKNAAEGIISDLLVIANDEGDFVYCNISGKIDIKKLSKLIDDDDINIKGLDHLKDIDDKNEK